MPSAPKTLLGMIAMPAVRTCAPQSAFSGLWRGPRPAIVFDDDVVTVGNQVNCWIEFFPIKRGNSTITISGVTRDRVTLAAIGGCVVKLFTTTDDVMRYQTVSDASGVWSIAVPSEGWAFYADAYLPGGPDKAGTTVNTLVGTVR